MGGSEPLGTSEQDLGHLGGWWTGVHRALCEASVCDLTCGSPRGRGVSASEPSLESRRHWHPYAPSFHTSSQRIKERRGLNGPVLERSQPQATPFAEKLQMA